MELTCGTAFTGGARRPRREGILSDEGLSRSASGRGRVGRARQRRLRRRRRARVVFGAAPTPMTLIVRRRCGSRATPRCKRRRRARTPATLDAARCLGRRVLGSFSESTFAIKTTHLAVCKTLEKQALSPCRAQGSHTARLVHSVGGSWLRVTRRPEQPFLSAPREP